MKRKWRFLGREKKKLVTSGAITNRSSIFETTLPTLELAHRKCTAFRCSSSNSISTLIECTKWEHSLWLLLFNYQFHSIVPFLFFPQGFRTQQQSWQCVVLFSCLLYIFSVNYHSSSPMTRLGKSRITALRVYKLKLKIPPAVLPTSGWEDWTLISQFHTELTLTWERLASFAYLAKKTQTLRCHITYLLWFYTNKEWDNHKCNITSSFSGSAQTVQVLVVIFC